MFCCAACDCGGDDWGCLAKWVCDEGVGTAAASCCLVPASSRSITLEFGANARCVVNWCLLGCWANGGGRPRFSPRLILSSASFASLSHSILPLSTSR